MTKIRDVMNNRLNLLAALGLVMVWSLTGTPTVKAQGAKPDTHDHDEHSAEEHSGESEDVHGEEDEHGEGDTDLNVEKAGHAGHSDEEEEEEGLRLTPEQRERFGIVVQPAGQGSLLDEVSLPGEIVFNQDRTVHIVPRVAGIAREVLKSVGDAVKAGEIMAVIESRELADAKSEYLAAVAREGLADKTFSREKGLREKQVSSEQDYLESEQALAEARIGRRSAEQKLHALGLSEDAVKSLADEHDESITRYEIRSPIAGIVTEKHISTGESLEADAGIFTVVDMSSVWVNLTVYTKNLGAVRKDQEVNLRVDHSGAQARGKVAMVTAFVDESTRSATARVVLDNSGGEWVPGTFVTGFIRTSEKNLPVVVPRNAVQNIEGRDVVFVEHEGAFEMSPVTLGRADRLNVEIVDGLEAGTSFAAQGAFQIKATVITSSLGSHAGHGH